MGIDDDSLTMDETAELYVAGGLTPDEHDRFRRLLDGRDPRALEAMRSVAEGAEALASMLSPVQPPREVRERLMRRIDRTRRGGAQVWRSWGADEADRVLTLRSDEGAWAETGVEGVQVRRLYVDRAAGRMTCMFRMEPGSSYPGHRHEGPEECYVLQGDLHVGDIVMHAGDYQRAPQGSLHGLQSTEGGCLLLVTTSLDDEMA